MPGPAAHNATSRRIAASLVLAIFFACPLVDASPAYASVQPTDIICGTTAAERDAEHGYYPDINAPSAFMVTKDGRVLFERDADREVKIASITKTMTAILALEHAAQEETLTVDHDAATVGESSAELKEGDTLTVHDALKALMIPSGNDAAIALADYIGAKIAANGQAPYDAFVDAMNAKARELGMDHTVFANPHGLDFNGWEGDFHSTARDVATMFSYAMQNDDFRALTAEPDNHITVTGSDGTQREITMKTHNVLLGTDGNIGGKTGTTYEALSCFVGAFNREAGGETYTVVLGSENDDLRWQDTRALETWYYNNWVPYPLMGVANTSKPQAIARIGLSSWSDKSIRATLENTEETSTIFAPDGPVSVELSQDRVRGTVRKGDTVGTITLKQNGRTIGTADLISMDNQAEPNAVEWLMVQEDRLVRFATGKPTTMPNELLIDPIDPSELVQR